LHLATLTKTTTTATTTTTTTETKGKAPHGLHFFSVVHQMCLVMSSAYLHPGALAVTDAMQSSTEIAAYFTSFLLFVSYSFM